jgi:transcriptional regulator with XRE-family HTH domain
MEQWTAEQFKTARKQLGLSVSQTAQMLETSRTHIRRMEITPTKLTHRPVTETKQRLMQAYLDGYRPPDWPLHDHIDEWQIVDGPAW